MQNFRTYQLAVQFYRNTKNIEIKNTLVRDQFERASLSVVLNLSEGSGKGTEKDRRRFYQTAFGSLREVQTLLHLMMHESLNREADTLAAHIYKLIQKPGSLYP